MGAAGRADLDAAPDPIEHASPDVELAEAQLALGRPDLAAEDGGPAEQPERQADEREHVGEPPQPGMTDPESPEQPTHPEHLPAQRAQHGNRLAKFIQGSWRELQRVQWPDRRQVMQATGVVIGFVIVAGAFLGVADLLAGKIVNFVLTGNFK